MSTHNLCFEQKYEKYQNFYLKSFIFFGGKIFSIFEYACFCNDIEFSWKSKKKNNNLIAPLIWSCYADSKLYKVASLSGYM